LPHASPRHAFAKSPHLPRAGPRNRHALRRDMRPRRRVARHRGSSPQLALTRRGSLPAIGPPAVASTPALLSCAIASSHLERAHRGARQVASVRQVRSPQVCRVRSTGARASRS
jgi:hypothetical protein